MTSTKDKLSASVRQAKAAQDPKAGTAPETDAGQPTGRAAGNAKKPAAGTRKPPAKTAAAATKTSAPSRKARSGADAPGASTANHVPESGTALFPDRVWPD